MDSLLLWRWSCGVRGISRISSWFVVNLLDMRGTGGMMLVLVVKRGLGESFSWMPFALVLLRNILRTLSIAGLPVLETSMALLAGLEVDLLLGRRLYERSIVLLWPL